MCVCVCVCVYAHLCVCVHVNMLVCLYAGEPPAAARRDRASAQAAVPPLLQSDLAVRQRRPAPQENASLGGKRQRMNEYINK